MCNYNIFLLFCPLFLQTLEGAKRWNKLLPDYVLLNKIFFIIPVFMPLIIKNNNNILPKLNVINAEIHDSVIIISFILI